MKKVGGSPEKTFYYGAEIWPCLVWPEQIGVWEYLPRGCNVQTKAQVDLKAITFEQQQLLGRYRTAFCSQNYSATIKVSPLSATSKAAVQQLEGPLSTESYPS